ncbi:arabinose-5-phosphate isomerase [Dokdonia sp. Hel_I_63]|uniref:KpsF/GutQ family sugar-phosphate isomerase n=1 Tax=unclassified Dokdonia TaxID=2615033 RepID=UPI00020A644E|nr:MULTISPECIES: KpsF/GutQ family sugar-phosphate isomerase [unclassified Dokdonia]AEE18367.1 KpsF/GutQ family protein [Dokdonia sp. 4H-3-7-5]TVZ22400.1 arabinose-5-phosphate isomerase [Dokdonia sp. Hel_I_63]
MNNFQQIIASAQKTIHIEQTAIANLSSLIDEEFAQAVQAIYKSKGRVVITGIGKSAIIAQKIVATLNSTGTPALFMHAADAIHGDLGSILIDDIVICISKSGNTPEIKVLVPLIKKTENTLIAITANRDSFLGKEADYILHANTEEEACPNNLAPTTSTTVQLVLGDAVAVALLDLRGFTESDFARYHPGGSLGKRLYLTVHDICATHENPQVTPDASIKEVIIEITNKMLGVTAVVLNGVIQGIITDGDLRRMLSKNDSLDGLTAAAIMSATPKTVRHDAMAIDAKEILEAHNITQLLVEKDGNYAGVVHIHDLIKEGIA